MATTYTTNYNLGKQENHADKFDMDVITDNADKIDAALTGLQSGIDGKQDTIDASHKLSSDLVDDTNKTHKFATQAQLDQIQTNKTNILLSLKNNGQNNIAKPSTVSASTQTGVTIVQDGQGHYEISGTTNSTQLTLYLYSSTDGYYCEHDMQIVGANSISGTNAVYMAHVIRTDDTSAYISVGTAGFTIPAGRKLRSLYIQVPANTAFSYNIDMSVVPKSLYDAGFTEYQPYAMSNVELTENVLPLYGKLVYSRTSNASRTSTYTMSKDDFGDDAVGLYMIYIINWSTTPTISIYAMAYSGNLTTQATLSKVYGADANIALDENSTDTVTYTGAGKIQIVAMINSVS